NYRRMREIFDELGMRVWGPASSEIGAVAELACGDPEVAERLLRQGIAELEDLGAHGYKTALVSLLAVALQRQGQYPDAIRVSDDALNGAGPDDHFVFMFAGAAKAESLAALGDLGTALAVSQIALDHGAV